MPLAIPTSGAIEAARELIADAVEPTPLVRLEADHPSADIYLKLETEHPIRSFKLRGALCALRSSDDPRRLEGVWTASAGNMAQGLAWAARRVALRATVVMPEDAPEIKRAGVRELGARLVSVPWEEWWRILEERRFAGAEGLFVHPVCEQAVLDANGTVGLEIAESLERIDAVLVPFGGGGLFTGIAAALGSSPDPPRCLACEVESAAPLARALAVGAPEPIERRESFVDGIGGRTVLPEMWPLLSRLVRGARVVSIGATAAAVRLLWERHGLVVEGAGAVPVAAALGDPTLEGTVVCVVSGGNIDPAVHDAILRGELPRSSVSRRG